MFVKISENDAYLICSPWTASWVITGTLLFQMCCIWERCWMSRNNQCCFCQKVLKAMHILTSLLVSSSDFLLIQYLSNSCKTWQNEGIGNITWNMQNGKNEDKKEGKTRNCQWPWTTYPIFVTNTTNISVEKFVM